MLWLKTNDAMSLESVLSWLRSLNPPIIYPHDAVMSSRKLGIFRLFYTFLRGDSRDYGTENAETMQTRQDFSPCPPVDANSGDRNKF